MVNFQVKGMQLCQNLNSINSIEFNYNLDFVVILNKFLDKLTLP